MADTHLPPANPDADREAQLADGVLDRDEGEDYNPNTAADVESHRARFEAANDTLRQDREVLEDAYTPVAEKLHSDVEQAQLNPAHQAVIPHQKEHAAEDVPSTHAGKQTEAPVPPHLHDGSSSPMPQSESKDILHPNGPAVPVQNNSLRKDG